MDVHYGLWIFSLLLLTGEDSFSFPFKHSVDGIVLAVVGPLVKIKSRVRKLLLSF